ncbi:MAG: hypothetical protein VKL39_13460 [Leptolyngbyaceae bacterium]|nr:hypothetical protein [Leptolyngbyaceae bacterium]
MLPKVLVRPMPYEHALQQRKATKTTYGIVDPTGVTEDICCRKKNHDVERFTR